jgi:hypothetical protein
VSFRTGGLFSYGCGEVKMYPQVMWSFLRERETWKNTLLLLSFYYWKQNFAFLKLSEAFFPWQNGGKENYIYVHIYTYTHFIIYNYICRVINIMYIIVQVLEKAWLN